MSRACRPRPSLSTSALQAIADRLNREWPVPDGWTDWHINRRRIECSGAGWTVFPMDIESYNIHFVLVVTGCVRVSGFTTPRQAWDFVEREAAE